MQIFTLVGKVQTENMWPERQTQAPTHTQREESHTDELAYIS